MNYIKIQLHDIANGPGDRVTLWLSGCHWHCEDCQNPETWDPTVGHPVDRLVMIKIKELLAPSYVSGLTITGGDPFYPSNRSGLYDLVKYIREAYPNKSIWVWTGYDYESISDSPVLDYIDVLVDGRYDKTLKDVSLPYCGSSNQRVIDIKKSTKKKVVLYEE